MGIGYRDFKMGMNISMDLKGFTDLEGMIEKPTEIIKMQYFNVAGRIRRPFLWLKMPFIRLCRERAIVTSINLENKLCLFSKIIKAASDLVFAPTSAVWAFRLRLLQSGKTTMPLGIPSGRADF
jgi:hypothetical protein